MAFGMPNSESLSLKITAKELQTFCEKLLQRSRDSAKTHDALVTLETFIKRYAIDSQATELYQLIETVLAQQTQISREWVLQENTRDLAHALKQCDFPGITAVHTPLSRNGFYEILKQVIAELTDEELAVLMAWTGQWVREARQQAQQASGYPDAMDFNQAGISITQYHAMNDIHRVLNGD